MSEAASARPLPREGERLIELLKAGDVAGAIKLTVAVAAQPNPGADKQWWVEQFRQELGDEVARIAELTWAENARAKAERPKVVEPALWKTMGKFGAREATKPFKLKPLEEPKTAPLFSIEAQPSVEAEAKFKVPLDEVTAKALGREKPKDEEEAAPKFKFHESDRVKSGAKPTIEEKQRALQELADLRDTDPLEYASQRKVWADRLCTTVKAIDGAVRLVLDKRIDDSDQSQATKITAIGVSEDVQLWHSEAGDCYATVRVGGHWENYRIGNRAFEQWLRSEYGSRNQVKIGDQWVPQAPGSGALKDAISQLEGIAKFKAGERQPAIRVGGDHKVIWIDLCKVDWKAVRVTDGGREVVSSPDVAFVRNGTMLELPEPTRGGNVQMLRSVVNVRAEEFVLIAGWLLQGLNPVGPYPLLNVCGSSEAGKSTLSKILLRTFDPNSAGLRRPSRKVDDLLLAAKNGWTVGLDNMSWMTAETSDILCMIATGIATGTRAHYTNDEEHVYDVQRPILFNGISGDLIERSDLASRTIKLQISPIAVRRTELDLGEEFERIWPGVFGALLDGLVGALRGRAAIVVAEPARLMDFERFAEAGCRAMGFRKGEFVEAYAANRQGSMAASAEASAVGRAVVKFMNHKDGRSFAGKMADLYQRLDRLKDGSVRDWPKDATRLSTELSRVAKPLAAIGIDCRLRQDRRTEGGGQNDVILTWSLTSEPK